MGKVFFDVFPTLQLNPDVSELLTDVEVTKITTNRDRSSLRVYIDSRRLIHKKSIYYMEDSIADQLFPGNETQIKVVENYHLSGQYTPEKLLESYKDSILTELRNYNAIEYSLFRRADSKFIEDFVLQITLEDSIIAREKAEELKRILEKIFVERCGFPIEARIQFKEGGTHKKREQDEQRLRLEVIQIQKNANMIEGDLKEEAGKEQANPELPWSADDLVAAYGESSTNVTKKPEKKEAEKRPAEKKEFFTKIRIEDVKR